GDRDALGVRQAGRPQPAPDHARLPVPLEPGDPPRLVGLRTREHPRPAAPGLPRPEALSRGAGAPRENRVVVVAVHPAGGAAVLDVITVTTIIYRTIIL